MNEIKLTEKLKTNIFSLKSQQRCNRLESMLPALIGEIPKVHSKESELEKIDIKKGESSFQRCFKA